MKKAKLLRNQRVVLEEGRFVIEIKAYEIGKGPRFPEGIKLKCVLVDALQGKPRILLDNHEPFGFHFHSRLPEDPDFRVALKVRDYEDAIQIFFTEVRKVLSREK